MTSGHSVRVATPYRYCLINLSTSLGWQVVPVHLAHTHAAAFHVLKALTLCSEQPQSRHHGPSGGRKVTEQLMQMDCL